MISSAYLPGADPLYRHPRADVFAVGIPREEIQALQSVLVLASQLNTQTSLETHALRQTHEYSTKFEKSIPLGSISLHTTLALVVGLV